MLNDLRLALGTRLGVTEDDPASNLDPDDPDAQPRRSTTGSPACRTSLVHA